MIAENVVKRTGFFINRSDFYSHTLRPDDRWDFSFFLHCPCWFPNYRRWHSLFLTRPQILFGHLLCTIQTFVCITFLYKSTVKSSETACDYIFLVTAIEWLVRRKTFASSHVLEYCITIFPAFAYQTTFLQRGHINHFCNHTYSESYIYRLLNFGTLQIWILNGNYVWWQLCHPEFSANELSRLLSMCLTHGSSIVCMC